ncbi:MAG: hypothetical protein R2764_10395 [Bacteroidales bacterium]
MENLSEPMPIYGILVISAIVVFDRIRKRQLLEKERRLAKEKELEQAKEIEKAYTELKATQSQLIQSEKWQALENLLPVLRMKYKTP